MNCRQWETVGGLQSALLNCSFVAWLWSLAVALILAEISSNTHWFEDRLDD